MQGISAKGRQPLEYPIIFKYMQVAVAVAFSKSAEVLAVDEIIDKLQHIPGALMPILHAVQDRLGHVPKTAVARIASGLNLSLADVHGVITFYHYFRQQPGGRHVVHVCRAEACQSVGARDLEAHATRSLGVDLHGTTADGAVTLEPVYCLGNCALGPSVMIDKTLHGRVNPARFDALMATLRRDVATS